MKFIFSQVNFGEIHPVRLRSVLERKLPSRSLPRSFLSRVQTLSEERWTKDTVEAAEDHGTAAMMTSGMLINSRGMEEAMVKVGGFGSHGVTNHITYFLPSLGRWRHLSSIPHVECCNYGCAVARNELFVVGGCFNQSLQEHIHPFGFR